MSDVGGKAELRLWAGAAAVWLLTCAAAVCIAMLGLLSVRRLRSPVEIESSYAALVVGQAVFLLFLWPLFEVSAPRGRLLCDLAGAGIRLLSFFFLAAPLVLLTAGVCEVETAAIARSQALAFVVGAAVAAVVRLPGAARWYYPAAFVLSGGVPFVALLLYQEGGVGVSWAAAVSPIWAVGAAAAGTVSIRPFAVFALVMLAAAGVLLLVRRDSGRMAEPAKS